VERKRASPITIAAPVLAKDIPIDALLGFVPDEAGAEDLLDLFVDAVVLQDAEGT
jgi:hypothetical protein